MLLTTKAVVLYLQPYSDKAHILHTYTRAEGRTNFMVYGIGKRHSGAVYAPLSLVEITANRGVAQKMPILRQINTAYIPSQIQGDIKRQTIALFLAEVLFRTLQHPLQDIALFDYVETMVQNLDTTKEPENLHIRFMTDLAAYLGFGINDNQLSELLPPPATRHERQVQLQALCNYYKEHIDDWQEPRSLDILIQLFD